MNRKPNCKRPGFTMIELLLILGVLLFLLGFLVPAVQRVRSAASRTQSLNNLKQLTLAVHSINDAYNKLPPVVGSFPVKNEKAGTLFFHLLPFIEQNNVYQQAKGDVNNNATYGMIIPTFLNPMDKSAPPDNRYKGWLATTSYATNWMVFGHTAGGTANIPQTFLDGTSNTIVYTERYQGVQWQSLRLGLFQPLYLGADVRLLQQGQVPERPDAGTVRSHLAAVHRLGGHSGGHGRRQRASGE